MTLEEIPHFDPNKEPVVDINGIKELLPHRPPFLMVDRIIDMGDDYVVGIKNIGINEGFFIGHFPEEPVRQVDEPHKYSTYFAKIDNTKFKKKVVPGDVLVLKLILTQPMRRSIVCMHGQAYVGDTLVCESDMIAQIIKNKE